MIPGHVLELLKIEAETAARERVLEANWFGSTFSQFMDNVARQTSKEKIAAGLDSDIEQIQDEFLDLLNPTKERVLS